MSIASYIEVGEPGIYRAIFSLTVSVHFICRRRQAGVTARIVDYRAEREREGEAAMAAAAMMARRKVSHEA